VQLTQHAIIAFLTAENIHPINIPSCMQAVYGDKCVDVSKVRHWVWQFKQGVGKQVLFLKTKIKIDNGIILAINSICCYIVV
jgi:hypothetical protein